MSLDRAWLEALSWDRSKDFDHWPARGRKGFRYGTCPRRHGPCLSFRRTKFFQPPFLSQRKNASSVGEELLVRGINYPTVNVDSPPCSPVKIVEDHEGNATYPQMWIRLCVIRSRTGSDNAQARSRLQWANGGSKRGDAGIVGVPRLLEEARLRGKAAIPPSRWRRR
jgi:hypothetical protein